MAEAAQASDEALPALALATRLLSCRDGLAASAGNYQGRVKHQFQGLQRDASFTLHGCKRPGGAGLLTCRAVVSTGHYNINSTNSV